MWDGNIVNEGIDINDVRNAALKFAKIGAKDIKIYGRIIGYKYNFECILESKLIETIE